MKKPKTSEYVENYQSDHNTVFHFNRMDLERTPDRNVDDLVIETHSLTEGEEISDSSVTQCLYRMISHQLRRLSELHKSK